MFGVGLIWSSDDERDVVRVKRFLRSSDCNKTVEDDEAMRELRSSGEKVDVEKRD